MCIRLNLWLKQIGLTLSLFTLLPLTLHAQTDEVILIDTKLIQTIVTVFDKENRFVDGLKQEDFALRVGNQPVPISFFENVVAGSHKDRTLRISAASESGREPLSFRQRTIIFFVDDRHLSLEGIDRTRKTLTNFLNQQMGQNDWVAIASASGQVGFLQQFTDNKDVLRSAIARLNHVPYVITDYGGSSGGRMTENMALSIERKDDPNVFEFYVQDCLKFAPRGVTRQERATIRRQCEVEVQNRARQILVQAGAVTAETYYSLDTLLATAEQMPGSKLAFFMSDGFLADTGPRGRIATNQLERLTDKARRAGVVIYTIDTRGLVSGALDATGNVPFDPNGRLESANAREIAASQDALNSLAVDTGGRALRNQNVFDRFIDAAVSETSRYYLLAWRPESSDEKGDVFKKMELTVNGRPDLTVRFARSFVVNPPADAAKTTAKEQKNLPPGETALRKALSDTQATQALPLQLALMYLDTPASGVVLTTSVQVATALLSFGDEQKNPAELSLAGVVLNDQGKPAATLGTKLNVKPPTPDVDQSSAMVIYNFRSPLKPGIYQVRLAARDDRSGRLGSAMQWIVIPDLSIGKLALSSLILGIKDVGNAEGVQWSIDKKFARNSPLKFMAFIYNSSQSVDGNLAVQVRVHRDGQTIISGPLTTLAPDQQSDPKRIVFNGEVNAATLQPGRYLLEVSVHDRKSQQTAAQQSTFFIQ